MKNKFIKNLLILVLLLSAFVLSGCDGKKPEKGYVSAAYITENIVSKFASESLYSKYSFSGTLNYFALEESLVPHSVDRKNVTLRDSIDKYSDSCTSYYLRLPLHITKDNWYVEVMGEHSQNSSTQYRLESRIYAPNSGYPTSIYYYERLDGGFILKAFGVNKKIKMNNPTVIECSAKWNITVEYDKDGYLVREVFETINSHKDPDTKTVYGQAEYTYVK